MRIGIIADDLTGAMDSAAPFADRGLATEVLLSPTGGARTSGAAVLAIDTHSRDLPADAAARAVRTAVSGMAPGRFPFKKIDSTLRGNVAAEVAAAMQATGCTCALVTPAAPAHGRVLRDGQLFVNGEKVGTASLVHTLREGMPGRRVQLLRAGDAPPEDAQILVADAASEEDLARIAALGMAGHRKVLLVGSSGLAAALADRLQPVAVPREQPTYERLLLVVGSHNARSAEQARKLQAVAAVTTLVLTSGGEVRGIANDGKHSPVTLVHVEGLDAAPALDPGWVASRLADVTADLLASGSRPTALFMTGGDTARAILSRLDVQAIDVLGNLYPGVVHGRATVAQRPVGLVTKAGGFGSTALFVDALGTLVPTAR